MYRKKKYIAVFLVREQNTFSVLRVKRFKPDVQTLQYKTNNSHTIDVSSPTYSKGLKLFYFIDISKTNGQLFFEGFDNDNLITPEVLDSIIEQGIIKQLTSSLSEKFMGSAIMNLIIGGIIGLLAGWIIAGFF